MKVFGDLEDAENDLLKAFGLERVEQVEKNKKKTLNIVDDSDEAISKYIAEIKSELNINESQNNKNEKVFGDLEDAENDLLKAFGLERVEQAKENIKIIENKEVKDDNSRKAVQTNESHNNKNEKETIQEQQHQDKILSQSEHQEKTTKQTKDSERFGNEDEAASDMLKAFGMKKPAESPKEKAFNVIDDSDEALDAALKEFLAEMSNISANPMFNPKLMNLSFKLGAAYLQKGFNNFTEWSSKMVDSVGSKIEPWLKSTWDSI